MSKYESPDDPATKWTADYNPFDCELYSETKTELWRMYWEQKARITDLEAALVVAHRDLATAQQEDADMTRDRDDALMALGEMALRLDRTETENARLYRAFESWERKCTPAERALIEAALVFGQTNNSCTDQALTEAIIAVVVEREAK